jgi:HEAT repeat protein
MQDRMTDAPAGSGLDHPDPSVRMKAALWAGMHSATVPIEALIDRCAVEPDFFVRDMLTWALTRHPADDVVPRLLAELGSTVPQARSQALHTLSKLGDRRAWPSVSGGLLHDSDDEVARSAWRAAVALVPAGSEEVLARELARHLGRGDQDLQRSLSRALVALGEASAPPLAAAAATGSIEARAHAMATQRLLEDPESGFIPLLDEAKRAAILGRGPIPGTTC